MQSLPKFGLLETMVETVVPAASATLVQVSPSTTVCTGWQSWPSIARQRGMPSARFEQSALIVALFTV